VDGRLAGQPANPGTGQAMGCSLACRAEDEIQFYSLRCEIMREIDRIAHDDGVSKKIAMKQLQGRQRREEWSIDKICKRLRREAKERGREGVRR
jgi:hypothetical protein